MSTGVALWSSPLTNPLRAGPWPRAPPRTRENRLPTGWVTAVCHVPGPDRGPPHMHTHTHLHTCAHTTRTPKSLWASPGSPPCFWPHSQPTLLIPFLSPPCPAHPQLRPSSALHAPPPAVVQEHREGQAGRKAAEQTWRGGKERWHHRPPSKGHLPLREERGRCEHERCPGARSGLDWPSASGHLVNSSGLASSGHLLTKGPL